MSDKILALQKIRSCSVITSSAFTVIPSEWSMPSNSVSRLRSMSFFSGGKSAAADIVGEFVTASAISWLEHSARSFALYRANAARRIARISSAGKSICTESFLKNWSRVKLGAVSPIAAINELKCASSRSTTLFRSGKACSGMSTDTSGIILQQEASVIAIYSPDCVCL